MSCVAYEYSLFDLFIPPFETLENICYISDKASLFVTSFIRLFIIAYISYYMFQKHKLVSVVLLIYTIINISIFIYMIFKSYKYTDIDADDLKSIEFKESNPESDLLLEFDLDD